MRKVIALSAIFFISIMFSCKKDGALTPDFDNGDLSISFTDTFSIKTSVVQEDSLRTDLSVYHLLGLYNDPIFGPVSSSIYSQVTLTGANLDFGVAPVLDSVVLTLDYVDLFGDTASPLTINVFKLSGDMDASTDYYSNTYVAHDPTPLASLTFTPNIVDSVHTVHNNATYAPHLRIKLPNSIGTDIFANSPYSDNTAFLSIFKGFYITTQDSVGNTSLLPGAGSIVSFDLNSSLSTLSIYYHYNETEQITPLKYDFTINTDGKKFSRFAHNYTGTDIEAHLNALPTKDTTVTYISTLAGVKTKVEIPFIKDLVKNEHVVINKAELVLTLENGTEGNFDEPLTSISLVGIDANNEAFFLPDFYEGLDHYGGSYDETTTTYTFNISRYVNELVYNTTNDYGMYLIANSSSITARRSVIGSENNVISKIRLNITYSKL